MRKTFLGSRGLSFVALIAVGVVGFSAVASADTVGSIDFESYTTGNVNGQQGWSKTGPYDVAVVQTDRFGFGKALRISNAVTSQSFGDHAFSPGLTEPAGESARKHFEASFDIATTSDDLQPGLQISLSPDHGDGGRMSYLRFLDTAVGVEVYATDATFAQVKVATLSRTSPHSVRFLINFKTGESNDDVKIFIDGKKVWSGTTWEDYFRFDPEQTPAGNKVPEVSKMLFRAGGAAAETSGNGFLIDNLALSSS